MGWWDRKEGAGRSPWSTYGRSVAPTEKGDRSRAIRLRFAKKTAPPIGGVRRSRIGALQKPSNNKHLDRNRTSSDNAHASRETVAGAMPWRSTSIRPCDARVAGPDTTHFRRPVAADKTPGQAHQRAQHNARQIAQRGAQHVAMIAHGEDTRHVRARCSRALQHTPAAPYAQPGGRHTNAPW